MSDLSNLLGNVYGSGDPDGPPVRREPAAASMPGAPESGKRALDHDLAEALSAALVEASNSNQPAVAPQPPAYEQQAAAPMPAQAVPQVAPAPQQFAPPAPAQVPPVVPAPPAPAPAPAYVPPPAAEWAAPAPSPAPAPMPAAGQYSWSWGDDDIVPGLAPKGGKRRK